ncbi:MAG: hypothetical protein LBU90_00135 [Bacteroidales bacterium]|nr:hypothetical protein [Bacteroidales bacterium]
MKKPICIVDSRAPQAALARLAQEFEVLPFRTQNITYEAVSCHPDVFLFQYSDTVILAPNIPHKYKEFLHKRGVSFTEGSTVIDETFSTSVAYNCAATKEYFFHKRGLTEEKILQCFKNHDFIQLPQAYTRCSMLAIENCAFITSDNGIEKVLQSRNFDVCYIRPQEISLPPYSHGFIGGCMGIFERKIYLLGALDFLPDGEMLRTFARAYDYEIVELYEGKLYDGGGLFFLKSE